VHLLTDKKISSSWRNQFRKLIHADEIFARFFWAKKIRESSFPKIITTEARSEIITTEARPEIITTEARPEIITTEARPEIVTTSTPEL
jgi:hypothetical protein